MQLKEALLLVTLATSACNASKPLESAAPTKSPTADTILIIKKEAMQAIEAPKNPHLLSLGEILKSIEELAKSGACPAPTDSRLVEIKNRLETFEGQLIQEKIITNKVSLNGCTLEGLRTRATSLKIALEIHLGKAQKTAQQFTRN